MVEYCEVAAGEMLSMQGSWHARLFIVRSIRKVGRDKVVWFAVRENEGVVTRKQNQSRRPTRPRMLGVFVHCGVHGPLCDMRCAQCSPPLSMHGPLKATD